jgi:histidyl-tRNA synthetase
MPPTLYQAPTGTQDILPEDVPYWTLVENEARRQARLANYGEIRTPTFEHSAVFRRGVGETTDIVEKEIYSFVDRGGDDLTLRPEGTAATVRAYLQRGMSSQPKPVKLFSLINAFRRDRPQRGRFREFHQFNVEALGEEDPLIDAELVALQLRFYAALGLDNLKLQINSIGDPVCRPSYIQALRDYFEAHRADLCDDCRRRLETNPLRLLDDKTPTCQPILNQAPRSIDHLCDACRDHFAQWQSYLSAADLTFTVNHRMVRGLDYYTRSVWEVWPQEAGAQSTIGGGGRYDGLAEQLGGPRTPGVGFATGLERIILAMREQEVPPPHASGPAGFLVVQHAGLKRHAFGLAERLRQRGITVDLAFGDRKLGKQLDAANKSRSQFAVILGDDELARQQVMLKDLRTGEQQTVAESELSAILELHHSANGLVDGAAH